MVMSNSFFHFKKFTIHQDQCAMKVSTDACIQGAWTPVTGDPQPESQAELQRLRILDIGAGTGLLSLMLAQRNEGVIIDAIEFKEDAANQAVENVQASPWKDRINVIHADAREFDSVEKYQIVISNPPFFINSLKSPEKGRSLARHNDELSLTQLFSCIERNVGPYGYASIMLPPAEQRQWKLLLQNNNWSIFQQLNIVPTINASANRVVSLCRREPKLSPSEEDLLIRDKSGSYTPEFINLLRPFYLKL
jgi:tRNA1Val (adenine37-N6)-methyltransferase